MCTGSMVNDQLLLQETNCEMYLLINSAGERMKIERPEVAFDWKNRRSFLMSSATNDASARLFILKYDTNAGSPQNLF